RVRRARREAGGAEVTRLNAALFVAQRASAAVLAVAVAVHLATIIYAVRGGLTAAEILGRTRHNGWFLALYLVFVLAVAIPAPLRLPTMAREGAARRGRSLDAALAPSAAPLAVPGISAALALFRA